MRVCAMQVLKLDTSRQSRDEPLRKLESWATLTELALDYSDLDMTLGGGNN